MRVWVYPDREWADLGAERWEVEWQTIKPKALARVQAAEARGEMDEIDPDGDVVHHVRHYPDKHQAVRAARGIVNLGKTAYGCATVQKQVVDWFVEEDHVAEWAEAGEAVYLP